VAEIWRRHLQQPPFSDRLCARVASAASWLRAMVDPINGEAPNLGHNDGANLLPLTDAGYRDYRPAAQLATVLFEGASAYAGAGWWTAHLDWLGVGASADNLPPSDSVMFDDGGYAILRRGDVRAMLRYPRFRFRPAHADVLHVDLWVAGENCLRDGGSFSYAASQEAQNYFSGARGHNSIQFDDREQMPRVSRFLWGDWLETSSLQRLETTDEAVTVGAAYRDTHGATHARHLELRDGRLTIRDTLGGFSTRAVVRWRLRPESWTRKGATITDGRHGLTVSADTQIVRAEIVTGWESLYYGQKTEIPVFEVELAASGVVTTEYRWSS
jgi:hypothetical protein